MQNESTPAAQRNAKSLRSTMTDSERKLWSALRAEQLGVKFRRQHPFGSYVADFACLDPKLIVELDGSQHRTQAEYDERRDRFFREHGFSVLRFPTDAPLNNLEGVCVAIQEQIRGWRRVPPPQPSPRGGGSKDKGTSQ